MDNNWRLRRKEIFLTTFQRKPQKRGILKSGKKILTSHGKSWIGGLANSVIPFASNPRFQWRKAVAGLQLFALSLPDWLFLYTWSQSVRPFGLMIVRYLILRGVPIGFGPLGGVPNWFRTSKGGSQLQLIDWFMEFVQVFRLCTNVQTLGLSIHFFLGLTFWTSNSSYERFSKRHWNWRFSGTPKTRFFWGFRHAPIEQERTPKNDAAGCGFRLKNVENVENVIPRSLTYILYPRNVCRAHFMYPPLFVRPLYV